MFMKRGEYVEERIKELRKALGLTQQKFAESIGVRQNTVAQYEIGRNPPTDTVITLICREWNVSETWLRTGEGEMFQPRSRNEELLEFAARAAEAGPSDVRAQLLAVMARLTDAQWQVLAEVANQFVAEVNAASPAKEKADPD